MAQANGSVSASANGEHISLQLGKQAVTDAHLSQVRVVLEQKKTPQERPKFYSFSWGRVQLIMKARVIREQSIMDVLCNKAGLSRRVPVETQPALKPDAPMPFRFDAAPACYANNPATWPFRWNDVPGDFCVNRDHLYFRFHVEEYATALKAFRSMLDEFYEEDLRQHPPEPVVPGFVSVFRSSDGEGVTKPRWVRKRSVKRAWDTIYLPESVKDEIVSKIRFFVDNKAHYDEYDVPYKFVTLLEGVPGTGKTSLVTAVGSTFGYDIYCLTITPRMTATSVDNLVGSVPERCLLLIEDVDALFADRKGETNLDFSTFINLLDGLATARGAVIFLTTNHADRLDAALNRDGRVDHRITFGLPTEEQIGMMLRKVGAKWANEHEQFLVAIRGKKLTLPRIQRYLFDHWRLGATSLLPEVKQL